MLFSKRWLRLVFALSSPLLVAACDGDGGGGQGGSGGATGGSGGATGGSGGQGGSGGATGGSGGQGGSGGASMSLADDGLIQNDCAPNDGAAVSATIGTGSACGEALGSAPQVRFLAFPASVAGLVAGDTWTYVEGTIGEIAVTWLPEGPAGMVESPESANLEVISVSATEIELKYSFQTMDGTSYAGTATVSVCDSTPLCG